MLRVSDKDPSLDTENPVAMESTGEVQGEEVW